jgi:hypothetical protein
MLSKALSCIEIATKLRPRRGVRARHLGAALLGLAALAGCSDPITINIPQPGATISPDLYTVELEAGYGLDRNSNGIVDIPNSPEYVQRPLRTKFDFTGIALFMPSVWPVPEGGNPGLGKSQGPWRWTFKPVSVPQNPSNLPMPASSIASATNNAGTLVTFSSEPVVEIELFEGTWEVQFARMNASALSGSPIYWRTANVEVEDHLIVQLGDSYSAGEGAPDAVGGVWADDGNGSHPRAPNYAACVSAGFDTECFRTQAFGTRSNLRHELAHRSSLSWGSLVAQSVEDWTKVTSVTFVHLAATGAELKHLTQSYASSELPPLRPPNLGALHDALVAVQIVDPITGNVLTPTTTTILNRMTQSLPAQLTELVEIIGPRKVDVLLMSMGGNDAGFSHALAAYMIRDSDEDDWYPVIEGAVASGNWGEAAVHSIEARESGWDFPTNLPGLVGLPAAYANAASSLISAGIAPQNVYLIEYPDPLVASTSKLKGSHADDQVEVCPGPIMDDFPDPTLFGITFHDADIGRGEQRHARGALIHPINAQIATATEARGWNLVGQVQESMYRNPICSSSRMVKTYFDSVLFQGDDWGTMHPNDKGHAAIAQIVAAHIHLPNAWRAAAEYEDALKPEGQAYTAGRPNHRVYQVLSDGSGTSSRTWLSVGLYPTSGRAFVDVPPNLCNGRPFAIDAQAPHNFVASGQTIAVEPFKIDNAVLRIFRRDGGEAVVEVGRLQGYGTLNYTPTLSDLEKEFFVVASTPVNAHTEPRRFARVRGAPTNADQYGTFEIRARCP